MPDYPEVLKSLILDNSEEGRHFRRNIRYYNNAFAMAAFCPKEEVTMPGPGCIRIRGEVNTRVTTSVIPYATQSSPKYAQIYIYDDDEAMIFRTSEYCRPNVIKAIQNVMAVNPYTLKYKNLYERYQETRDPEIRLIFTQVNSDDHRRYNTPSSNIGQVAAIIFTGKEGNIPDKVDFVVYPRQQFESLIMHKLSGHIEPMAFPLLFPKGTRGYSTDLKNNNHENQRCVTAVQYFGYRLALRNNHFNPILLTGRLTQQYIIHSYVVVEWNRLNYIQQYQPQFRRETFQGLTDHIENSGANTSSRVRLGNAVILPSTFSGGPRAQQQLYHDSMAIARELGRPDLFVTFTANPKWPEIAEFLKSMPAGTSAADIPHFVVRAFNIRLNSFIKEIFKGTVFGAVLGYVYTVEFQKRGLPHAHCIFILKNKLLTPEAVDKFIYAEIPKKETYPQLHKQVIKHMLHGPHGQKTLCWNVDSKLCSKKFPRAFCEETNLINDGFPEYRRRNNRNELNIYNARVNGKVVPVDNSMVVPYNPYLLLKYDCHINVEYCGSVMAFKYIHKYIHKGHDRIRVQVQEVNGEETEEGAINEIDNFIDTRYVSAMEAAWRILELPTHGHSHSVMRLPVHLPGQQHICFTEGQESNALSSNRAETKLTAFMKLNQHDPAAKKLKYFEIPRHYTYNANTRTWNKKKRICRTVVRLYSVSPKDTERFFLKVLLNKIEGPTSFDHIRTVDGTLYGSFKEAAYARGFGTDHNDYEEVMHEASVTMMPQSLRAFFAYMLLTCEGIDGKCLWNLFKEMMCHGTTEESALREIEQKLRSEDRSLQDFGIETKYIFLDKDDMFDDHMNTEEHKCTSEMMIKQLNTDQSFIFEEITSALSVSSKTPNSKVLFFVDGPGGTGKTFLYKCLYHSQRQLKKNIVSVAWTGIAAILLPFGRTAHRLFKLPLKINSGTPVAPVHLTVQAKRMLVEVDIIIWDEASMIPSFAMGLIDVTLKDLMRSQKPFGGKCIILGGDFCQVLPVVKKAGKRQIIEATLTSSPLWPHFRCFKLIQNMRSDSEVFSQWLLSVGNGELDELEIPPEMLCVHDLISEVFGDISENSLTNSILLAPRNDEVELLNLSVLNALPGEEIVCESNDWATAVDGDTTDNDSLMLRYQPEYLTSLNLSGLPQHRLKLKIGCVVMLIRNICINDGLCNGTRLVVRKIDKSILYCSILTGDKHGNIVAIPCITLNSKDSHDLPFVLNRKQFPVRLAFAMTINKSQGQSFDRVGIRINQQKPIFGHGQLYVALSRCRSMGGIKIQIVGAKHSYEFNHIQNIVYKDVLTATV